MQCYLSGCVPSLPTALFVCVIIFVRTVLSVVATPFSPGLRPHLSSRPACTSLGCSGVSWPHGSPAARPSEQRPLTQQPAQSTGSRGPGRSAARRRLELRAQSPGEGTLHDTPFPRSRHQAEGPVFPNRAPLDHVPNGSSPCAPSPLWSQISFPQALQCRCVRPPRPSVQ